MGQGETLPGLLQLKRCYLKDIVRMLWEHSFFIFLKEKMSMNMKHSIFTLAAAAMLAAGCSGAPAADEGTDKDTFTVGMECDYAPFN